MRMYSVYVHTNKTNGKVYVGLTCQKVERRWSDGNGYKHSAYFCSAIQKHGWDGFLHVVVAAGLTREEACRLESELIAKYDATNRLCGYNSTYGGEANVPTEETRAKMKKNHNNCKGPNNPNWGRAPSTETREKLSIANKGKKPSPLTMQRALEYNTGRKDSAETRKKKSIARIGSKNPSWGKPWSDEKRNKIMANRPDFRGANNPKAKAVVCINAGVEFLTCKDAAEWCGLKNGKSHVGACCRGKVRYAGRHPVTGERLIWEFKEAVKP